MITLGFSTLTHKLPSVLQKIEKIKKEFKNNDLINCSDIFFQVVSQGEEDDLIEVVDNVKIFRCKEKGLSKSRNLNISNCCTRYLWTLDDDVYIDVGVLVEFMYELKSNDTCPAIYLAKVGALEHNGYYKDYSYREGRVSPSKLQLLKSSSIELIIDVNFFKEHSITYNEAIGLGTEYPGAEENNLLLDVYNKGGFIKFVNYRMVLHTTLMDGRQAISNNIYLVRGATASRFDFVGVLLIVRWCIRLYRKPFEMLNAFYYLTYGYTKGYDYFK